MPLIWLRSSYLNWVLLVGAVSLFFMAEAVVIVAWLALPKGPPANEVYLLGCLFINTVPILAGLRGTMSQNSSRPPAIREMKGAISFGYRGSS